MSPLALALAGIGIFVVGLGLMIAGVSVLDLLVRAVRRRWTMR